MRISDWSSDVCSPDLTLKRIATLSDTGTLSVPEAERPIPPESSTLDALRLTRPPQVSSSGWRSRKRTAPPSAPEPYSVPCGPRSTSTRSMSERRKLANRSEEHTSELQSIMRNSYAVFCLKKKTTKHCMIHD